MQPFFRYALYIIGFIVLFSFLNFWLNTHPPKFRSRDTPAEHGLGYEAVRFETKDGLSLAGWLIPGKKNSPTVIVGHGYPFDKGNILPVVKFLHPDYTLFLFDFRSFGESEGSTTTAGVKEIEDFNAAIRYLKSKDINHTFGAYGFSLSAATFLMAEHPEVKAIVADSSYASIHDIIGALYSYFGPLKFPFVWMTELYGKMFYGIDAKKYRVRVTVPTLLIHGGADSQIHVYNSQKIYDEGDKKLAELWIIEGADHGMSYATNPKAYKAKVKGFFDKHL